MNKKIILLLVAAVCIALYFYGSKISPENQFIKLLPIVGGLAFGLNTLIQLGLTEEDQELITNNRTQKQV